LVTIGSGVSEGAGVEFPTFLLTCVVVLKTLWHYRASVWSSKFSALRCNTTPHHGFRRRIVVLSHVARMLSH